MHYTYLLGHVGYRTDQLDDVSTSKHYSRGGCNSSSSSFLSKAYLLSDHQTAHTAEPRCSTLLSALHAAKTLIDLHHGSLVRSPKAPTHADVAVLVLHIPEGGGGGSPSCAVRTPGHDAADGRAGLGERGRLRRHLQLLAQQRLAVVREQDAVFLDREHLCSWSGGERHRLCFAFSLDVSLLLLGGRPGDGGGSRGAGSVRGAGDSSSRGAGEGGDTGGGRGAGGWVDTDGRRDIGSNWGVDDREDTGGMRGTGRTGSSRITSSRIDGWHVNQVF
ncbi:hypothetical protein F4779DRAFT_353571 [Xylariaceae sp. FL0662B]|nr:hypothetical protein F4779DRAFT_353571 [Xylariaceae sp. FL0662B]